MPASYEIEILFMAELHRAIQDSGDAVVVIDCKSRAAVGCDCILLSEAGMPIPLLEEPNRLNVRLQFDPAIYEQEFHAVAFTSSSARLGVPCIVQMGILQSRIATTEEAIQPMSVANLKERAIHIAL
jgi:hypothetical protein